MATREEDREFLRYRESGDPQAMARVESDVGEHEAYTAADQGQHGALSEQLPHEPRPAGAQRRPDSDFLLTS